VKTHTIGTLQQLIQPIVLSVKERKFVHKAKA